MDESEHPSKLLSYFMLNFYRQIPYDCLLVVHYIRANVLILIDSNLTRGWGKFTSPEPFLTSFSCPNGVVDSFKLSCVTFFCVFHFHDYFRWGSLVKLCLISLNKHSTAASVSRANPHKWFKCVTLVLVHRGFINTGSQRKDQANMPRMPTSLFIKSIVGEAN